jgi:acyl-CoA reductase-like NAD-dependent aldehyde dehydrogenase
MARPLPSLLAPT